MSDISPRYPDGSALDVVHLTHNDFGPQVERLVDYLARFVMSGGGGSGIPASIIQAKGDLIAGMGVNLPGRLPAGTDGFYLMADSGAPVGLSWRHPLTLFDFKGDLIVGTGDNTAVRLPAGQPGFYLMSDPSTLVGLSWQHPLAIIQAKGDLIAGTAQNVATRLPVGVAGFFLMADPAATTGLSWQHPLSLFDSKGDIIVGTGFRTSDNLPVGLPGFYLMADPLTPTGLSWQHPLNLFDARGDMIIATADNIATRLPLGTDGFVLTADRAANAMGVKWAVSTGGTGGGIPPTIINAKGDLVAGTANDTPGILPVGTPGFYLMADPLGETGLSWQHPLSLFAAKGDLLTGTSALTATRLPVGPPGFYLMADPVPAQGLSWQHPLALFQDKGDLLTGTSALTATRLPVGPPGYYLMADPIPPQGLSWQHPLTLFQAAGDLLAGTGINAAIRVPIGTTNGQVLTVDTTLPVRMKWATSTQTGIPGSILTTKGDLIAARGNSDPVRVPVGTSGFYLMADNLAEGGVSWQHPLTLFDSQGDLLAGTGSDAASKVPLGANGQVLTVDTSINTGMRWTTPVTPSGGIPPSILTSAGDLITATGASTPVRLPRGSTGMYLMADGGVPAGLSWQHPLALFQQRGDLLAGEGANVAVRVAGPGISGYYLMSNTAVPGGVSWQHPLTLFDAKGDILVGIGNDAATRLPALPTATAGGYGILTCNPDITTTGLRWEAYPLSAGWGGTGVDSPPAKQLLVGNGIGPFLSAPAGPSGYYLMGDTAQPTGVSWQHPLTLYNNKGDIIVGIGNDAASAFSKGPDYSFLISGPWDPHGLGWVSSPIPPWLGGTGINTPPAKRLLVGNDTSTMLSVPSGTSGYYLMSDPGNTYGMSWQHPLTLYQARGDLLIGSGFNAAVRLGVASDYHFLMSYPSGASPTGVQWTAFPLPEWLGGSGVNSPPAKRLLAGGAGSGMRSVAIAPADGYYLMSEAAQETGCSWQHPLSLYNAAGDLLIGTGDNAATTLPKGAAGQILSSTAGSLAWINSPAAISFPLSVNQGGTGLTGITAKSLLVGAGASPPLQLLLGSNGYVLMSDFNNAGNTYGMKWENPTIGYLGRGYILGGTGSGTAAPLAPGTNGQQLTADNTQSTGLRWGSPTVLADADFLALQAKVDDMLSRLELLEAR